jgi:hypothetical protein
MTDVNDGEIELFLHTQGAKPRVATARSSETLRDLLARVEVIKEGDGNFHVFLGECAEALEETDEVDNGADQHPPADINLPLEVLELKRHRHVHVHKCRHVAVAVHFGGKTKHHKFSPATTVALATEWARKKFQLDPAAAAEYVLQLCDSSVQPRSDQYLSELTEAPGCSICFDLVKEVTPQG